MLCFVAFPRILNFLFRKGPTQVILRNLLELYNPFPISSSAVAEEVKFIKRIPVTYRRGRIKDLHGKVGCSSQKKRLFMMCL